MLTKRQSKGSAMINNRLTKRFIEDVLSVAIMFAVGAMIVLAPSRSSEDVSTTRPVLKASPPSPESTGSGLSSTKLIATKGQPNELTDRSDTTGSGAAVDVA